MFDYPKHVFDLLQQQLSSTGRTGATRYYVTPAVPTPAALGGISIPANIRFTKRGIVLAMYGQDAEVATTLVYAQVGVRCQIGGTQDLFLDGQGGPAYASMLALFGGQNCWTPLLRRVEAGDDWTFTFKNNRPSGNINPQVTVGFIADADLAEFAAQARGQ